MLVATLNPPELLVLTCSTGHYQDTLFRSKRCYHQQAMCMQNQSEDQARFNIIVLLEKTQQLRK